MGVYPLRVEDERRAIWQDAADREGRSLADWIRRACDAAALEGEPFVPGYDWKPAGEVPEQKPPGPSQLPSGGKEFKGPDPRGGRS